MMKTTLQLVLCVLVFPYWAIADMLVHDPAACNTAQVIACGTDLRNESNLNASNLLDTYSCDGVSTVTGYNGKERIYRIDVNFRQEYDIRLGGVTDPELNFNLFLMRDGCSSGDCMYSSTNPDNSPERILANLNPGTYYLVVDTWANELGRYNLTVDCGMAPTLVSCEDARPLWCDELLSGDTWGKTSNFSAALYNCYNGTGTYNGGDEIYSFTKSRASDHIQIHLFTETPNLNIFLVSRCDQTGFSCVATGLNFNGGKFIDEEDIGLPAGEYYVVVDGRNSATDGDYSILLTCDGIDFDQAEELICGRPKEDQNFAGTINQQTLYACNGSNQTLYNGGERLYYFDVEEAREITLKLDKTSTYGDLGLFLFREGTNRAICLEAGTKINLGDEEISIFLNRGRYYVVVDNRKEGFFTLSLTGCDCHTDGTLYCDEELTGSNAGGGDDVLYTAGACSSQPLRLDAQDRVYKFTAPESQMYQFRLSNLEKDLGLFIFEDCNDPETCIGYSNKRGTDVVDIFLNEGQVIFVAVDGTARLVTSSFALHVICDPLLDDDGDGIDNGVDNCPQTPNPVQQDFDNDGEGDLCDLDDDNDGVLDAIDCDPFDADIDFSIGQSCNDGDDNTINDRINSDCMCMGEPKPDADGDGISDDVDNCINIANTDQADNDDDGMGNVCDDDDDNDGVPDLTDCDAFDPLIAFAIGDVCDDGDANTTNDRINKDCNCMGQVGPNPLQLFVENATGSVGDTVCFDITATEFNNVSSLSFSVTLDNDLAKIISITNQNLMGGTFTGSGCAALTGSGGGAMTGSLSSTGGFVVWSADIGQSLTLGPVTPIVEVCAEILTDDYDKATVSITDLIRDIEFFDFNADPIEVVTNDGQICRDTTAGSTNTMMTIAGTVMDITSAGLKDVSLELSVASATDPSSSMMSSDAEGAFAFAASQGGNFELRPTATDEFMENVSVLDILLFRRHFIFNKSFESPYQYVAADIDGNGRLSIRDEQLMKLMILGNTEIEYPLWRFVKADHVWPEVDDFTIGGPIFDYPQSAEITDLSTNMNQDFIGVRMGDLQIADLVAVNRSSRPTALVTQEQSFQYGDLVTIPLYFNNDKLVAGLSVELDFDESLLDYNAFKTQLIGEQDEMLVTRFVNEGKLIIQWVGDESMNIDGGQELLEVFFIAKRSGRLSQSLTLSNVYRPSELIDTELEVSELSLSFEKAHVEEIIVYPNPTRDVAILDYNSNIENEASLNFYNVNGQHLSSIKTILVRGENKIEIRKEQLDIQDGLIIIELINGQDVTRSSIIFVR